MFSSPSPIAFSIFNYDVHWYGILMSISMLIGLFVILFVRKKFFKDITEDSIFDISFILITAGILSARLYYVLVDWQYFIRHPYEIIAIWNGGLSIQGAILGCILTFIYYAQKHNLNFFRYADLLCFGLITGQIIGRWGNFFNSEAFGLPTNIFCKLYIPIHSRPLEYKSFEFFHPTFLYESLCNFFILIILYFILCRNKKRNNGMIFYLYILLYSTVRFFIEKIRIDSVLNIYNIPIAQITSLIFIIISIIGLVKLNEKDKTTSL